MKCLEKLFRSVFNLHEVLTLKRGERFLFSTDSNTFYELNNLGKSPINLVFINGNYQIIAQIDSKYTITKCS